MDPAAEIYYSISPYAYCYNNPLKYIDPTGMIIEDPDSIFRNHKQTLNNNIAAVDAALKDNKNAAISQALIKLKDKLSSVLNEYKTLENSKQIYNIFSADDEGGYTTFQNGKVMIGIGDNASFGLIGHELKHAQQFDTGKISFKLNGSGYGTLYDLSDETEAYNRERMLNAQVTFFTDPRIKWTNSDVKNLETAPGVKPYSILLEGPISINSRQGKEMRQQMINAGQNRIYPVEVYKGAQSDYKNGIKKRR
jgi:uncharacterized protein YdcH (DUF465 family)